MPSVLSRLIILGLMTPASTTMLLLPLILARFNIMATGPFVVKTFESELDCDEQCLEVVSPLHSAYY